MTLSQLTTKIWFDISHSVSTPSHSSCLGLKLLSKTRLLPLGCGSILEGNVLTLTVSWTSALMSESKMKIYYCVCVCAITVGQDEQPCRSLHIYIYTHIWRKSVLTVGVMVVFLLHMYGHTAFTDWDASSH